jgi:hypothetical protein
VTGWNPPEGAGPTAPVPPPAGTPYGGQYGGQYSGQYCYGWQPAPPVPPAPRPGIVPLRPLGVGELLDGSFTAIRTAAIAALGAAAIFMLVDQAVHLLLDYTVLRPPAITTAPDGTTVTNTADVAARTGATYIVTSVLSSIVILVLTGVMAAIVGERLIGRRVTTKDAWARLRPVAWPLVQVALLITLIIAGIVTVAMLPGIAVAAAGSGAGGTALIGLGVLAMAVPVIYLWTTLSLAPAVIVLERQGVRTALRRSRKLVHGSWWRVFWIALLAWLIALVVTLVLSVPFLVFGGGLSRALSGHAENLSFTVLLMNALGGFVGGTLSRPFQSGVSALLYIDRRMRAEGLDMALQAASSEPATTASTPAT